jgi:hypothetical protein
MLVCARRFKLGAAFNMIAVAAQMGCGAQWISSAAPAKTAVAPADANDAVERLDRRRDGC